VTVIDVRRVQTLKRDYETVVILDSTADDAKTADRVERVTDIITSGGGEVTQVQRWGRRKLAYEINRRRDGIYFLIRFSAEPAVLKELDHRLKLDELVLRHMTVLAEDEDEAAQTSTGEGEIERGEEDVAATDTALSDLEPVAPGGSETAGAEP
jgi:small subunit ribosomal protein S6